MAQLTLPAWQSARMRTVSCFNRCVAKRRRRCADGRCTPELLDVPREAARAIPRRSPQRTPFGETSWQGGRLVSALSVYLRSSIRPREQTSYPPVSERYPISLAWNRSPKRVTHNVNSGTPTRSPITYYSNVRAPMRGFFETCRRYTRGRRVQCPDVVNTTPSCAVCKCRLTTGSATMRE